MALLELITTVEKDPWGKPYSVVMKRLRSNRPIPGIDLPGRLKNIVNSLFPTILPRQTTPTRGIVENLVKKSEIEAAASSMCNRKTLGTDCISNELLKATVSSNLNAFERIFSRCMSEGRFPAIWKRGKLVLIPIPGRPLENPSSYRLICLLNGYGKLLEKLVVARHRDYLSSNRNMADNQYGFRQGRSTLDA